MKTMAEKRNKVVSLAIAALLVAALLIASVKPAFAADSYTLYGSFAPGESEGYPISEQPTEFSLYKVGGFNGPDLVLDKDYGVEINVNIDKPEDADTDEAVKKEWTEEWMTSAQTLADYVLTDSEQSPVATATTDGDGHFTMSGLSNGLYLLTGTSQKYKDEKTGTTYYWWPRPMYVVVLNGDVEIEVKPGKALVNEFIVKKTWAGDEEYKDEIRPKSVEVEICYDGEVVYTETLSGDNDWSFSWETDLDRDDPSKWTVTEKMTDDVKANYQVTKDVSITEGTENESGCGYITITNTSTYEPPEPPVPPEEPEEPTNKPSTGDDSRTTLLIAINASAILLLALAMVFRRKSRNQR